MADTDMAVPRTTPDARCDARDAREIARARRLVCAAQQGDRSAREELVAGHLELVRVTASRYRNLGMPYEDLVQEGSIGLLEAIDGFDARRSTDFDRYARFRIRRAIRAALTDQSRVVRLPKHVVERRRAIDRAAAALNVATGRTPTSKELAAATGLSLAAVRDARAAAVEIVSLDQPVLPDGSTLSTVIADPAASDPQTELLQRERVERLRSGLDALSPRQRTIVVRHWGLDGAPATTHTLASELHLSAGRARTIANNALFALRTALDANPRRPSVRSRKAGAVRRRDQRLRARRTSARVRAARQSS